MTLEHLSLRQHGLTVALLATLWATACGGTFTGAPGSGGTGAGGSGAGSGASGGPAGGAGPGAGAGGVCNGACPLIECVGVPTMEPGQCCPVCEPYGGSGGISSGGSGGVTGCNDVPCPDIGCAPGWKFANDPTSCCPTCVPDGGAGGGGGCLAIACPAIACAPGFQSKVLPGECCPTCVVCTASCPAIACANGYKPQLQPGDCCSTCVPDDTCAQGQKNYSTLRQKLLQQPGAVACKVDNDCALLSGNAYCGDECSQVPVNAAAAQSIESQLSSFASSNCSTCTPMYASCSAPPPPSCINGQCLEGAYL